MGTVFQAKPQSNDDRHPRWHRTKRAARFAQCLELQTQGVSQRSRANVEGRNGYLSLRNHQL